MTFRQSVLALAAPVLSIALVGCQPPLEEKKDGAMAPSTGGATSTPSPTPTPAPTDAKPTDTTPAPTPSAEAPKDVTPAPTESKKEETPKS